MLRHWEHRRSERVLVRIPIIVSWDPSEGVVSVKKSTETEAVSAHGVLIRLGQTLAQDTPIEITHRRSGKSASARVVWAQRPEKSDDSFRIGVELSVSSETFWGISLPPKR